MFIGEYKYTMDKKRRMSVPAKMREDLGDKAVITRGIDNCLVLYPVSVWEELAEKLQSLPSARGESRAFVRLMFSGAAEVTFDKLGRILVPSYLADYANLEKEVAIIGMGNRIEVWEEERWSDYRKKKETKVENMAEKLEELGI